MQTKTSLGVPIELEAFGAKLRAKGVLKSGEAFCLISAQWGKSKDGQEGLKGRVWLPKGREMDMILTIPRKDFEKVLAEAGAAEAERAAVRAAQLEADRQAALTACPADCEITRRLPMGCDACTAEYESEDGTKVLDSDMLPLVHGWAFISRAKLDERRAKIAARNISVAQANAKREADRRVAFALAKATGKPVLLSRWSAECNDPREECSQDVCAEWAHPDGSTTTTRNHCW